MTAPWIGDMSDEERAYRAMRGYWDRRAASIAANPARMPNEPNDREPIVAALADARRMERERCAQESKDAERMLLEIFGATEETKD